VEIGYFAGIVLSATGLALGSTYHVSTIGNDNTGDGTASKPWATIGFAAGQLPAKGGDTILVANGTYNGGKDIERSFADWVDHTGRKCVQGKTHQPSERPGRGSVLNLHGRLGKNTG